MEELNEYEYQDLEMDWDKDSEWYKSLMDSLNIFEIQNGELNSESNMQMLRNLVEAQNSLNSLIEYLPKYGYVKDLPAVMAECLRQLEKCIKFPSKLKGVLEQTAEKIRKYLEQTKYKYEPEQQQTLTSYVTNREKLYKFKVGKLEEILREVCPEIQEKTKAELSLKKDNKKEAKVYENIKEKEIQNKINEIANMMILNYYATKYRV